MKFLLQCMIMSILPFYRVDFPIADIPKPFTEVQYIGGIPHKVSPQNEQQRHKEIVLFLR